LGILLAAAAALAAAAGHADARGAPAPPEAPVPPHGREAPAAPDTTRLEAGGLRAPVEIVRDPWGIAHIRAENTHDLFFAQGWSAARDRLFQFEIWRRRARGTVAEVLGPEHVERDRGARLFRYRGDLEQELDHYHPRGSEIIRAFVEGVNARVDRVRRNPELMPVELEILGIRPGHWTARDVISRHGALLGAINAELDYGRAVHRAGPELVKELSDFRPGEPKMALDPAVPGEALFQDVLGPYNAWRSGVDFRPEDVAPAYRAAGRTPPGEAAARLARAAGDAAVGSPEGNAVGEPDLLSVGSNNWVVRGELTRSGAPFMANDPHRSQQAPSLRYFVHLRAPGWNVIGGGEPTVPGVSIGHNEHGAWGLTVFPTDNQDLYVYETHPDDPRRYRYRGGWERMRVITDTIPVEGEDPRVVELAYTRHGPVTFEDEERNLAFAVRAAWLEPGGAQYLASLRMDQARTWREFRNAASYSNIPGENFVWADTSGTIGWQSVGIAPIRPNWSGLVPVPGDGRYEWDGYLPIRAKPHVTNPDRGFWATANNELIPEDYPYMDAVGYRWSAPYRAARIEEVLGSGRRHSLRDMMELMTDYTSLPARELVPLLMDVELSGRAARARERLRRWDHRLRPSSVAAGIYAMWERVLQRRAADRFVPEEVREYLGGVPMRKLLRWLQAPGGRFGPEPVEARDRFVAASFRAAVERLNGKLGPEIDGWVYGQEDYKHALIRHPLSAAVNDSLRERFDVGPLPRGGNGYTVNNSGGGDNQTHGPSFRVIADLSNWDRSVATQAPGQGGRPGGPHYEDLFGMWARDRFFPLLYSRGEVDAVAEGVTRLVPGG
ncbi:MAG: penicillin acylase family protein, partial [Candidatus Palauibacterales bacterium]|nr:penicillin acylase family protein [Candidatus Palauibacterales bacterium]